MRLKLSEKAIANLMSRLEPYLEVLRITVDALGLEGEWSFDPATGELLSTDAGRRSDETAAPEAS